MSCKNCPKCGSLTTVSDSRTNDKDQIRRRRECPKCKFKFTTYELSYNDLRTMEGKIDKLNKIIKLANEKPIIR